MLIGILGGGQLGRMLALAGYPFGLRFRGLDPAPDAPLGQLADLVVAPYDDSSALDRFVRDLDLVTYEFENVPGATAQFLSERVPVFPPPEALIHAQDRLFEKQLFETCGIPVPRYAPVSSPDDFARALEQVPLPALLKTRRLGYDGRGQARVERAEDLPLAWEQLGGVPCLLEERVPFDFEVSLLAARSQRRTRFLPARREPAYGRYSRHFPRSGTTCIPPAPASGRTVRARSAGTARVRRRPRCRVLRRRRPTARQRDGTACS